MGPIRYYFPKLPPHSLQSVSSNALNFLAFSNSSELKDTDTLRDVSLLNHEDSRKNGKNSLMQIADRSSKKNVKHT